jgi:cyclopropane fatty-acyl-phospholipid synthase-like methyltransferase
VSELATTVPLELKNAVATGWLTPGTRILDIGSGGGQISAWLVEQGFRAVGGDLAHAATELARRRFSHLGPALEYRVLDILRDQPEAGAFDALIDRGCFHGIGDEARYIRNVAVWAKPGARMLLLHKVDTRAGEHASLEERQRTVDRKVREAFEPMFEVERSAPALEPLARSSGNIPRVVWPGMVFWLHKR